MSFPPDPEGRAARHAMIDRAVRRIRNVLPPGYVVKHDGDHVVVQLGENRAVVSTDWVITIPEDFVAEAARISAGRLDLRRR